MEPIKNVSVAKDGRVYRHDAHRRGCAAKLKRTERIQLRFAAASDGLLPPPLVGWLLTNMPGKYLSDLALMLERLP